MILKNVSVSQVETHELCPRKWYFNKVLKIPIPPTLDTELGQQKHGEVEDYFRNGTLPTSECVKRAIKLLPPRHETHLIEHKFELKTYDGGPPWIGYIDLIDRRDPKETVIYDHKTTGSFRWAKTPVELMKNLQLLTYAKAVSELPGKPEVIKGAHCYMQIPKGKYKNPEDAMLVPPVVLSKDAIKERWQKSLIEVKMMVNLAHIEPEPKFVDPNWNACSALGGCPYYAPLCSVTDTRRKGSMLAACTDPSLNSTTKKESVSMGMSLLEKLQKKNGINGSSVAPTASVIPPVETKAVEAIVEKPKPTVTISIEEAEQAGIIPPDAPAPMLSTELETRKKLEEEAQAKAAEATPAPKRRGRPPKAATAEAPTNAGLTGGGPLVVPQHTPAEVVAGMTATPQTGFHLYVDCLPTKGANGPVILYEDWIAPIADALAIEKSVEDYRLLPYGSGKSELAIAVRKAPLPVGCLIVPKMAPGADEVLAVLKPKATTVVQALKG